MKSTFIIPAFFIVVTTGMLSCSSQKNMGSTAATTMIDEQRYTFVATSVFPTEDSRYSPRLMFPNGSNLYQLTSRYDLKITPDSVTAYLPFFGRAYSAPIDPTEGGIKFTSTDFSYKKSIKKGNYEIEIIPRDTRDVRNLYLTISPSGYGSLRILSNNRTPIAFNGQIEKNNRE